VVAEAKQLNAQMFYGDDSVTHRFIEHQDGQTQRVYLPPYSPALNPDGQVWNHAKQELDNRTIPPAGAGTSGFQHPEISPEAERSDVQVPGSHRSG